MTAAESQKTETPLVEPFCLKDARSLIETVFPVAKLSAESYKERKAGSGQRLTGVGKWWGRKPLVLVRATVLGCLLPATDDPQKDLKVFERLMGMDEFGLFERRPRRSMTIEAFAVLDPAEQLKQAILAEAHPGPSDAASWELINAHLGTHAETLQEVVEQLGVMRFGHVPKVGDVFAGGGSIPFEAARIGCDTYASDLNPVAGLLTWSNQALLCAKPEDKVRIDAAQALVYEEVDQQITAWGIEHDGKGRRADAYLWCNEVLDPETGYLVPLAATWVISQKQRVVAELVPDHASKRYDIRVVNGATDAQMMTAKAGTVVKQHLMPPPTPENHAPHPTHMSRLRERDNGGAGLRLWGPGDLGPQPGDLFRDRLYCVRWLDAQGKRHCESVTNADLDRENKALGLLEERFESWQVAGIVPKNATGSLNPKQFQLHARGWTHWHHLFSPRQLLTNGLFAEAVSRSEASKELLGLVGNIIERNAKMTGWNPGRDIPDHVFTGQSLSPLYNYSVRPFRALKATSLPSSCLPSTGLNVQLLDARTTTASCDLWITDPPYADAIPYEELSEFFLAWYEKRIPGLFPEWYADSKRALAVKGKGASFNASMIEVYTNLTRLLPENGMQVVMFTHQDAGVWADLAMTLWAAGLKVSAAWTVATETTDGLNAGANNVQGTVLLVLRKRGDEQLLFSDELLPLMEHEVRGQLDQMRGLGNVRFNDADLQLASYAAALRVITGHDIDGIDPKRELMRDRLPGEKSRVQELIEQASQVAANHLIPRGIERDLWRALTPYERYYLKGLEVETSGEHREGVYAELARSFTVPRHTEMFGSNAANTVRLSTPTELGIKKPFGLQDTLLRHVLTAVRMVASKLEVKDGVTWLTTEVETFHIDRNRIIALLHYLAGMERTGLAHWQQDARAATILAGAIEHHRV